MTVYNAIEQLIAEKKEQRRIPHCAEFRAVKDLVQLSDAELNAETQRLKSEGRIAIRETINSSSYYIL